MKILFVITGLGGGGAEKVVANLADHMHQLGHEVKIAYLRGKVVVSPNSKDIELVYMGFEQPIDLLRASKTYRQVVCKFQPDIVHAHMVHANIFVRLNRISLNVPKIICTAHNLNEGGKLRMLAYRYTDFLSDLNTNVSQEAVDNFIKLRAFNKENSMCVYNGIDTDKFTKQSTYNIQLKQQLEISKNTKILLAIGRLEEQKDYPNLFYALDMLVKKYHYTNFHLFVVGEGKLKTNLQELIDQLGLSEKITFLGRRNDIPELLAISDVFVLSSLFEGFGLVVAEAMACECLVVATDCGGIKEVMGSTGLLVPPSNYQDLSLALLKALNFNDVQLKNNGVIAKDRVNHLFNINNIINQWLKLYATN